MNEIKSYCEQIFKEQKYPSEYRHTMDFLYEQYFSINNKQGNTKMFKKFDCYKKRLSNI